jgi:hypothetical protein
MEVRVVHSRTHREELTRAYDPTPRAARPAQRKEGRCWYSSGTATEFRNGSQAADPPKAGDFVSQRLSVQCARSFGISDDTGGCALRNARRSSATAFQTRHRYGRAKPGRRATCNPGQASQAPFS